MKKTIAEKDLIKLIKDNKQECKWEIPEFTTSKEYFDYLDTEDDCEDDDFYHEISMMMGSLYYNIPKVEKIYEVLNIDCTSDLIDFIFNFRDEIETQL